MGGDLVGLEGAIKKYGFNGGGAAGENTQVALR